MHLNAAISKWRALLKGAPSILTFLSAAINCRNCVFSGSEDSWVWRKAFWHFGDTPSDRYICLDAELAETVKTPISIPWCSRPRHRLADSLSFCVLIIALFPHACVVFFVSSVNLYVSCSRWTAYSRKHRERPFSWDFLYKLLCRLDDVWEVDALSKDEVCAEYVSTKFLLIVVQN